MNKQELESAFNETTDNAVDLLKENVKLKNRIDKAIEYIEEYQRKIWLDKYIYIEDYDDLINILKGEDK